jgi:peptidyl-prolyl cis-trans isomerase C
MMPARTHSFCLSLLLIMAAPGFPAQARADDIIDTTDPQQVLAYQGDAVLTQDAIDAAFSRIPEQDRLAFVRDGGKVDTMIRSLLQAEIVALDAEKAGFEKQTEVLERVRLAARKEIAEAWIQELAKRTPAADYAAMAHEDYLAHPEHYATGVKLDVSHILIGKREHKPEDALTLAKQLKERLAEDPSQFDAMVAEYSDDPSKAANKGKFTNVRRGQMVKAFEDTAYRLSSPGQISDPVETEYGYHLIRLDRRIESQVPPFEQVKEVAEARMKAKHVESYRASYLQKLFSEPVVFPEGSIEIMARRYFGDELEKAPIYTEEGIKTNSE